jgi:hypothetical protein
MKVFVMNPDRTFTRPEAELRVGNSWQVGENLGFKLDAKTHVQLISDRLLGIDSRRWPASSRTTAVYTTTDWHPLDFKIGSIRSYKDKRPTAKNQAEILLEINKVAQIESNRLAAKKRSGGFNERIFQYVALGLLVMLIIQAIPVAIPALLKSLQGAGQ